MISIKINDINNFMQNLLIKDTFDSFLISNGEIHTSNTFTVNGRINKDFFNKEELCLTSEDFVTWKNLKHIFFEIIKGKKVPSKMKIIFAFPKSGYERLITECGMNIIPENIGGLYIHILYENNQITVITGASLNIFTPDKTLDKYWDDFVKKFLTKYFNITEM